MTLELVNPETAAIINELMLKPDQSALLSSIIGLDKTFIRKEAIAPPSLRLKKHFDRILEVFMAKPVFQLELNQVEGWEAWKGLMRYSLGQVVWSQVLDAWMSIGSAFMVPKEYEVRASYRAFHSWPNKQTYFLYWLAIDYPANNKILRKIVDRALFQASLAGPDPEALMDLVTRPVMEQLKQNLKSILLMTWSEAPNVGPSGVPIDEAMGATLEWVDWRYLAGALVSAFSSSYE